MSSTLTTDLTIVNIKLEDITTNPSLILERLTQTQLEQLNHFLIDTIEDKDGSPNIGNISIIQLHLHNNIPNKGRFRLEFTIDRRFCCSDIEAAQSDYIDFEFDVIKCDLHAKATYFNWTVNN